MALFNFDLLPVDEIAPWSKPGGKPSDQLLSWFALTLGEFCIEAGDAVLVRDPDYQVAAHVRGVLSTMPAAVEPLPPVIEGLVRDWSLLEQVYGCSWPQDGTADKRAYTAWRWLGEREPDFPTRVAFFRVGANVLVRSTHFRNAATESSEARAWVLPVHTFIAECHDLGDRLLAAMESRLGDIASGRQRPQIPVNLDELRSQHLTWRDELDSYRVKAHRPDIPWQEAEEALRAIAEEHGLRLSTVH